MACSGRVGWRLVVHTLSTTPWKLFLWVLFHNCKHILSPHLPRLLAALHTSLNGLGLLDCELGLFVCVQVVLQAVSQIQNLQTEATHLSQRIAHTHEDWAVDVCGAPKDLLVAALVPIPPAMAHLIPALHSSLLAVKGPCNGDPQALVQRNKLAAVCPFGRRHQSTGVTPELSQLVVMLFLGDDLVLQGHFQSLLTRR